MNSLGILFINTIQMFGGGEVWMLRTLKGLQYRGHRVFLLCRPGTELAERANAEGIKVYTLKVRGDFDPLTILQTFRILRKEKIGIVLTNMDKELRFAGMAAKLGKGCAVIPRRGIDYPVKNRIHYRFAYTRLADCIVANSQATRSALLRHAPWLGSHKIHVIYNGIDPGPFMGSARQDMRALWGLSPSARIIGFVGQFDERKGISSLLHAFSTAVSQIKDLHLVLAGEGPLYHDINAFRKRHGLEPRIHLPGFQDQVDDVMKAIDLLVLPSIWEGFGIVLIEAMAAAKPVIATRVSSIPEIVIDSRTGLLVPVNDPEALAHAFEQVFSSPRRAAIWGKNGRRRVMQEFTLEKMLDRYETLFSSCQRHP